MTGNDLKLTFKWPQCGLPEQEVLFPHLSMDDDIQGLILPLQALQLVPPGVPLQPLERPRNLERGPSSLQQVLIEPHQLIKGLEQDPSWIHVLAQVGITPSDLLLTVLEDEGSTCGVNPGQMLQGRPQLVQGQSLGAVRCWEVRVQAWPERVEQDGKAIIMAEAACVATLTDLIVTSDQATNSSMLTIQFNSFLILIW